jgi:CHASE2 domain-containing sensor protein
MRGIRVERKVISIYPTMERNTTMTTTSLGASPATRAPGVLRPAGVAVLLSAILSAVLVARNTDDGPVWRVSLVLAAFVLAFTALVFGLVVRRTLRKGSGRASAFTALVLGVLAASSLVVFWLALPPVFGVVALVLARDARDRRPFRGEAVAVFGAVLGALGMVAAFAVTAIS